MKAGNAMFNGLAAAFHIGADDWSGAGHRLQQGAWQAFTKGGEHTHVNVLIEGGHVMAKGKHFHPVL
ncbi:MAG: hypothetical protein R3E95_00930 [Thiolinea sp.]